MSAANSRDMSFYIPVRNAERTLCAAIASVRAQTVAPAEFFLVVDARSTDASVKLAGQSGLRVIEQTDGRLGLARNLAIEACPTRWLASCDADVTLEPTWLEALLHAADDSVAAVGGCTREHFLTAADRYRAVTMPHNWGPLRFDNPYMLVSEMIADLGALRGVGGYRPDLSFGDDSDLCRRLREAGHSLRYEPAAVAWHHRGDSVESVLDLRWNYSLPQQQIRLNDLPGLTGKLAINRVYCLQGLSQTLHSAQADTCAVAVLLWFHHAVRDARAALEKWPLMDEAARAACVGRLTDALTDRLVGAWAGLLAPLRELLPHTLGTTGQAPSEREATREARRPGPAHELAATPGFALYLDAASDATLELLATIPKTLVDVIVKSAEYLATARDTGGATPSYALLTPSLMASDSDRRHLAALPLKTAWRWSDLEDSLRSRAGVETETCRISQHGRTLDAEVPEPSPRWRALGSGVSSNGSDRLALLPHLESFADPMEGLRDSLSTARFAAIAYQPLTEFLAAVPILSARDLASACALAGFEIRDFHTEAGLTRLIVERASNGRRAPPSENARVAKGAAPDRP